MTGLTSMNFHFNPAMVAPKTSVAPGSGLQASMSADLQHFSTQQEVEVVAMQDAFLPSLALNGSLNRDEFINLSAQQNDLARLTGQLASDGVLTNQERAQIAQRRAKFQEDLAGFRNGDFHPHNNLARKGIAGSQDRQSAFLYDSVRNGHISTETALNLRMQMSASSFKVGQMAGQGASVESQCTAANNNLANTWTQLGSGQAVPRSGWSQQPLGLPNIGSCSWY